MPEPDFEIHDPHPEIDFKEINAKDRKNKLILYVFWPAVIFILLSVIYNEDEISLSSFLPLVLISPFLFYTIYKTYYPKIITYLTRLVVNKDQVTLVYLGLKGQKTLTGKPEDFRFEIDKPEPQRKIRSNIIFLKIFYKGKLEIIQSEIGIWNKANIRKAAEAFNPQKTGEELMQ